MEVKRQLRARLVIAAALLLIALAPRGIVAQQAAAQKSAAAAGVVARVPFETNGNMLMVQVRVNQSRPLWFVLDTGAAATVLNETVGQSLGLKSEGTGTALGAGGQVRSTSLRGLTLDVGGAPLKDVNAIGLALAALENQTGRAMDGILGVDFFRRYVVELDFEKLMLTLYEPSAFKYEGRGESLPLTFSQNHPHVRAKVYFPDRAPVEGDFVIDSGSNFQLILAAGFIESQKLSGSVRPTLKSFARGVGGEVQMPVGRSAKLQLGGYTVNNPLTAFPPAGVFAQAGKAGNIGSAVLRKFKVTFDYERRRMILDPNKFFADHYDIDMTGIGLASESPAFKVVRVAHVLEATPAAEAGLRKGDEIVAVNSRPAAEFGLARLRELFKQEGKRYTLRIKRGEELLSVELKTRRLA